jgi:hypothetical protein
MTSPVRETLAQFMRRFLKPEPRPTYRGDLGRFRRKEKIELVTEQRKTP